MQQKKIKVLGIAPYPTLKQVMIQAAKNFPQMDLTVSVGAITEGVEILKQYPADAFDCIISRGGTKMEVEKYATIPVIEIPISYFDLLNIFKLIEHYHGKPAILAYENIAHSAQILCDILQLPYSIFTIDKWHNAPEKVNQLKSMGYTLIIGDAVSVLYAEKVGLQSILLTSSIDSVAEAFSQGLHITSYISDVAEENRLLSSCLKTDDSLVLVFSAAEELIYQSAKIYKKGLQTICRHLIHSLSQTGKNTFSRRIEDVFYNINGFITKIREQRYFIFKIQPKKFLSTPSNMPWLTFYRHKEIAFTVPNLLQLTNPTIWQQAIHSSKEKQALCILGAPGTDGLSLYKQLFNKNSQPYEFLFIVDVSLFSLDTLHHFIEDSRSPLYVENSIFLFKGLAQTNSLLFDAWENELAAIKYSTSAYFTFLLEGVQSDELSQRHHKLLEDFNALPLTLPSLRQNKDIILNYALLLIQHDNHLHDHHIVGLEPEAVSLLCQYDWPWNLTQLKRVITEAIRTTTTPWIPVHTIRNLLKNETEAYTPSTQEPLNLEKPLDEIIYDIAQKILKEENYNQTRTAKRLHISRTTLWRILKKKGLLHV